MHLMNTLCFFQNGIIYIFQQLGGDLVAVNLSEKSCSPQGFSPVRVSGSHPYARSLSFVFLPRPAAVSDLIETSPAANQQVNTLYNRQFQFMKK